MTPTANPAVATYLDAVRSALSDLPTDELTEVMEDVAEHLAQLRADHGDDVTTDDLEARIGVPEDFAAELRSAAGYPLAMTRSGRLGGFIRHTVRRVVTWIVRASSIGATIGLIATVISDWQWGLAVVGYSALAAGAAIGLWLLVHGRAQAPARTLRALPDAGLAERWYRTVSHTQWGTMAKEFAASLRPAWWVARAWIGVQLLSALLLGGAQFPIPQFSGSVIVLLAAIAGSVWLGHRANRGEVQGWSQVGVVGANALAILTAPILLVSMSEPVYYRDVEYVQEPIHQFAHESGEPIINIFPYSQDGQLLTEVRLYDQDGQPIDNLDWWDECGQETGMYPGGPMGNVFPRPTTDWDDNGECIVVDYRSPFGPALPGFPILEDSPAVEPTAQPDTAQPDTGSTDLADPEPAESDIDDPAADPTEEPDDPGPDDAGDEEPGNKSAG